MSTHVWLGGLDGTTWWAQDADEPVYAASLVKVPAAIAAEALDLDRAVPVHAEFDSAVPGRWFELAEADDQDPETWAGLGGEQELRELRRRSLVLSGNLAANLVVEAVGLAACTAVMPQVVRMVGDAPAAAAGLTNQATARQWGELLGRVPDEVEDVLRGQVHRDGIPAGLPDGTAVANKTGWVDDLAHDMALVRPDGAEPFALVVLTRGEPDGTIATVAREAWGRRR